MKTTRYRSLLLTVFTAGSMVIGAKLHFDLNGTTLTMQTFFLCLTALFFKPGEVFFGQILYLVSGFFAPVFSGDYMGLGVLTGDSAGYLYAFPFAAFILSKYGKSHDWFTVISWTMVAHFMILITGFLWLIYYIKKDSDTAFLAGFMMLLPGAFVKGIAASFFYILGERFFKKKENEKI